MAEPVLCPYCGAEMHGLFGYSRHNNWHGFGWYKCEKCKATGPVIAGWKTAEEAERAGKTATLRRYTPPAKPLTREDIMQVKYETAAFWIEFVETYKAEPACHWYLWSGLRGYSAHVVGYCEPWLLPMGDYGRTWRCWDREPTEAERKAAAWTD